MTEIGYAFDCSDSHSPDSISSPGSIGSQRSHKSGGLSDGDFAMLEGVYQRGRYRFDVIGSSDSNALDGVQEKVADGHKAYVADELAYADVVLLPIGECIVGSTYTESIVDNLHVDVSFSKNSEEKLVDLYLRSWDMELAIDLEVIAGGSLCRLLLILDSGRGIKRFSYIQYQRSAQYHTR